MVKLYPQVPSRPKSTSFSWITPKRPYRGPIPPSDRSVIVDSWFCIPGGDWGDGRIFAPYCGAPAGIRCTRCNAQLVGHDPGDEDPRRP